MQSLFDLLPSYQKPIEKKGKTPHPKAATVNAIIELVGESKQYPYGYWLRRVGKVSYNEMIGILKEVEAADKKYSKGGMLTNILIKRNAKQKREDSDTAGRGTTAGRGS